MLLCMTLTAARWAGGVCSAFSNPFLTDCVHFFRSFAQISQFSTSIPHAPVHDFKSHLQMSLKQRQGQPTGPEPSTNSPYRLQQVVWRSERNNVYRPTNIMQYIHNGVQQKNVHSNKLTSSPPVLQISSALL